MTDDISDSLEDWYMSDEDLREAWRKIRALAERVRAAHMNDLGHDLCPWGFGDATEHPEAWNYIDAVLAAEVG